MEPSIVIKVKYGNTLRRFNADVYENKLELDMVALKVKIRTLFNLAVDAEITLTYIDDDGDVVTLVDDDDLSDVMRQCLNPVRITVTLNNDKGCRSYAKSSGSSTPVRSPKVQLPLPIISNGVEEILKSVPEPFRETLSKLSLDLASKAASSGPLIAELVDSLSKMAVAQSSIHSDSRSRVGEELNRQKGSSDINPDLSVTEDPQPKDGHLPDLNVSPAAFSVPVIGKKSETEKGRSSQVSGKTAGVESAKKQYLNELGNPSAPSITLDPLNECPFSGISLADGPDFPPAVQGRVHPSFKRSHSHGDRVGPVFHTGVQCDGCGIHPITGPRFKSKVKDDYDLCSMCFSEMGNEADYVRINHPLSYRAMSFRGLHDNMRRSRLRPPVPPFLFKNLQKHGRPRLDSHFILDVNVMDGTTMAPLTPFTKIWRMRNNGSLVWPRGTQLVWIGGEKFSDAISVEIETPADGVPMDKEVDIAVDFVAPERPGRYISYWRMASPSGQKFGQRVWVLIQVDAFIKDSVCENVSRLNLNLPPEGNGSKWPVVIDVNVEPMADNDIPEPRNSDAVRDAVRQPVEAILDEQQTDKDKDQKGFGVKPVVVGMPIYDQEHTFPINDSLLVGDGAPSSAPPVAPSGLYPIVGADVPKPVALPVPPSVTYPRVHRAAPKSAAPPAPPSVTYPIVDVDFTGLAVAQASHLPSPAVDVPTSSAQAADNNVEQALLKELQEMGFNQVDLNKEILRLNEYDLEQSLEDLCGMAEWDPILEELEEMGFCDKEVNKKLLAKNNGSIKGVVMDLIAGERAL